MNGYKPFITAVFRLWCSPVFCCVAAEYLLLRRPGYAAVPGAAAGGRAGDRGGGEDHGQETDLQGFRGHRQGVQSTSPRLFYSFSSMPSGVPDPKVVMPSGSGFVIISTDQYPSISKQKI